MLGGRTDTFFDSFRRLDGGTEVRITPVSGSVRQSPVDATDGPGSRWEGAYATGRYPVSSDVRREPMKDVVREHAFGDDRNDAADPGVQTIRVAYTVLRAALGNVARGPSRPGPCSAPWRPCPRWAPEGRPRNRAGATRTCSPCATTRGRPTRW